MRIIKSTKENLLQVLATRHHQLPTTWTFHIKSSDTLAKKNELNYFN
jgi:hypothetical protein